MNRYRKKPVVIEAVHLIGSNKFVVADWCHGAAHDNGTVDISTLEGVMTANVGDWIIKGVKGEFYPCKPDIFEATYEPVEDE